MMGGGRDKLHGLFFQEVVDYFPAIMENLSAVHLQTSYLGALQELHRIFHNIKGAASQVGLSSLGHTACIAELFLEDAIQQNEELHEDLIRFFEYTASKIRDYCLGGKKEDMKEEQMLMEAFATGKRLLDVMGGVNWPTVQTFLKQEHNCDNNSTVSNDCGQSEMIAKKESRETIRSIIKLLSQLNDLHSMHESPEISVEALGDIQGAIRVLRDCVSDTEYLEQQRFLANFDTFLEKTRESPLAPELEIPHMVGNFLTCLEMLFVSPTTVDANVVSRIVEKMTRVTQLLGGDFAAEEQGSIEVAEDARGLAFNEESAADKLLFDDEPAFSDDIDDDLFSSQILDDASLFENSDPTASEFEDGTIDLLDSTSDDLFSSFDEDDPVFIEVDEKEPLTVDELQSLFGDNESLVGDGSGSLFAIDEEDHEDDSFSLEDVFRSECEEHFSTISDALQILEKDGQQEQTIDVITREALKEMRRAIHTLKGAAAMTGFAALSEFAHLSEDLLDYLYEKAESLVPEAVALLASAFNTIEDMSQGPEILLEDRVEPIKRSMINFLTTYSDAQISSAISGEPESDGEIIEEIEKDTQAPTALSGSTGNVRVRIDKIDELVSLEGDLVVARNAMSGMLEELNQSVRELETAQEKIRKISNELEAGFEIQALQGFGVGNPLAHSENQTGVEESTSEFDSIELDRYSELNLIIRSLNEMSVDVGSIHSELSQISGEFKGHLATQEITMRMMQDRFMRVRMTPLSSVSRMYFQVVRDTASKLNKKVRLLIDGEDVYLDRYVWTKISDPIMHILRNCIDHGIETEDERNDLEKPDVATIKIAAFQRGNMIVLRIVDDGAGVDLAKLKQKMIAAEVVKPEIQLSKDELLTYLFHTGISTKDEITQISGRGVGLDVVQQNIHDLKGSIHVQTEEGEGTIFELNIPISLSVSKAIIVQDNDERYAVPLHDIREIRSVGMEKNENADALMWNGEVLHKNRLSTLLSGEQNSDFVEENEAGMVIVVEVEKGKHGAIVVDTITGQQEIVVKNLGTQLQHVHGISGVTDFGDGNLIPILNLSELAGEKPERIADTRKRENTEQSRAALHVLVVDDSISVRQSILRLLKKQNWIVDLARDGIDALEKLESFTPDIIVSDIEMPRMNGYDFKEVLNENPLYKDIPVVMLTSRISEKHQKKARELGVNKYVIKPYQGDDFVRLLEEQAQGSKARRIS